MQSEKNVERDVSYIQKLIEIGDVAMFVSRSNNGALKSRPMEIVDVNSDGEIFFFTTLSSELIRELTENSDVNLSFTKDGQNFISVYGVTQVIQSKDMLVSLWASRYEQWIPDGLDTPNIVLLKVSLISAEHWGQNTMLNSIKQYFTTGSTEPDNFHESIDS
jgi:general stress protein 26|tara:strand:- start:8057 stop:8542 length:486 start_codon:yes stop_codon:yes gene_type:complete